MKDLKSQHPPCGLPYRDAPAQIKKRDTRRGAGCRGCVLASALLGNLVVRAAFQGREKESLQTCHSERPRGTLTLSLRRGNKGRVEVELYCSRPDPQGEIPRAAEGTQYLRCTP